MSRFNVTLAIAASTAALVMEGCKTSEEKKLANMYSKYEKEMNKVTKDDKHTFDKCDAVEKNLQDAIKAEEKKQADKAKKNEKSAADLKKDNEKDSKYDEYKTTCMAGNEGKEEDSKEVQECIEGLIKLAKEAKKDSKKKDSKKENKDLKKAQENQLKYVQEYATCYITSDPSKADFTDVSLDLVKTYAGGFTFDVSDDKKSVTVKAVEVKA